MDIDDILQRAETRSAEEMANGGSSDLLAGFKVNHTVWDIPDKLHWVEWVHRLQYSG